MPTPMKRRATGRVMPKRKIVNLQSLQMMVRSGVVRRADSMPPLPIRTTRIQMADGQRGVARKESVSEQGWLSRIILGRRAQPVVMKRS